MSVLYRIGSNQVAIILLTSDSGRIVPTSGREYIRVHIAILNFRKDDLKSARRKERRPQTRRKGKSFL